MLDRPFRLALGAYYLDLPESADLSVSVIPRIPGINSTAYTYWVALIGRFRLGIYLDGVHNRNSLKEFIDSSTKRNVVTTPVTVNEISGVRYGDYAPPITNIDWNFKKGDSMLCLNLQEASYFAKQPPSTDERAEHETIIGSITYYPDQVPSKSSL